LAPCWLPLAAKAKQLPKNKHLCQSIHPNTVAGLSNRIGHHKSSLPVLSFAAMLRLCLSLGFGLSLLAGCSKMGTAARSQRQPLRVGGAVAL